MLQFKSYLVALSIALSIAAIPVAHHIYTAAAHVAQVLSAAH